MSLELIGQKLKAAREAQGLSLRQIYERTKIPINHLQAIDEGIAEDLPEPVYIAGFIKRYAEYVGLDGHLLSEEYRADLESVVSNGRNHSKPKSRQTMQAMPEYLGRMTLDKPPPTYKLWLFNSLIIVLIVGIICWFFNMQANNLANQPDVSLLPLKEAASHAQPGLNVEKVSPENIQAASNNAQPQHNSLSLSANQHVWVEVKALSNGESLFIGSLERGDRRDFQDSSGLRIRAGNGGSLSVEHQGKIQIFGTTGKVAERTFLFQDSHNDTKADSQPSFPAEPPAKVNKKNTKKPLGNTWSAAKKYHHADNLPGKRYVPGEGLEGARRAIEIPYRYSEGHADNE